MADLRAGVITDLFRVYVPDESVEEQWDIAGLENALKAELQLEPCRSAIGWVKEEDLQPDTLLERIVARADEAYRAKVPAGAEASFRQYERYVVLQILDAHWREHLAALDLLRQGIHLRGYAQKNKQEYKREAFELFGAMVEAVKLEVTKTLAAVQIRTQEDKPDDESHVETFGPSPELARRRGTRARIRRQRRRRAGRGGDEEKPMVRAGQKVGRNDPARAARAGNTSTATGS